MYTHTDVLSLPVCSDIKIQETRVGCPAGLYSPASHQRAAATLLLSQPASSPEHLCVLEGECCLPKAKTWLRPGFHRLLLDEPSRAKTSYSSVGFLEEKNHPKILPNPATGDKATDGEHTESDCYPGTGGVQQ